MGLWGPALLALVLAALLPVVGLVGLDLSTDAREGGSGVHLAVEMLVLGLAGLGAGGSAWVLREERRAPWEAATRAKQDARRWQEEAARWRGEAALTWRGLGEAIDRQFDRWQLSLAERGAALRLLKA